MEMPEKIEFVFEKIESPDPLCPPWRCHWKMSFNDKEYGGGMNSRKMDTDMIKALFDALADEAFMCIKLLNEPLLSRNEP